MKISNLHALQGTCREGPLESKVGEKQLVFFFGRGPTRPRGPSMANFSPVTISLAAPLGVPVTYKQLTPAPL